MRFNEAFFESFHDFAFFNHLEIPRSIAPLIMIFKKHMCNKIKKIRNCLPVFAELKKFLLLNKATPPSLKIWVRTVGTLYLGLVYLFYLLFFCTNCMRCCIVLASKNIEMFLRTLFCFNHIKNSLYGPFTQFNVYNPKRTSDNCFRFCFKGAASYLSEAFHAT